MCKRKRCSLVGLLLVLTILFMGWSEQVQSQEKYPTRPIDIICPFAAGASTDVVARITASYLKKKWGVPVNVINKPGGNTLPANAETYAASPDGYTMLADNQASCSTLEVAVKDLPFKVLDRTFIAILYSFPMHIMVPGNSPYKTLADAAADAKRDPENFTWTSLGGVSGQDVIIRRFFKAIGVDVAKTKPVMFKGGTPATAAIAGGNVKLGSTSVVTARAAMQTGSVRMLAISYERSLDFPDVPTFAELGFPSVHCVFWNGISGPPNLPSHVVDKWEIAMKELIKDPEFLSRLKGIGGIPFYHNPKEAKEYVKKEMGEIAELYGIKK